MCFRVSEKSGKKIVRTFSNNCSNQNKNRYFFNVVWYALNVLQFELIEHTHLVKGHTFNENDSVHSKIERIYRNMTIYTTPQWAAVICGAKKSNPPYTVTEMASANFYDCKGLSLNLKNLDLDEDKVKISISSLPHFTQRIQYFESIV